MQQTPVSRPSTRRPSTERLAWHRDPMAMPIALSALVLCVVVELGRHGILHPGALAPHFQLQAEAFLHGHLYLDSRTYDDVVWRGHSYLPWGPLPALLVLPAVAIFGSDFPMTYVNLALALATVPALDLIWSGLGVTARPTRWWLTLLTLSGTAYLSALVANGTYFTEHVVALGPISWGLALAVNRRAPFLAGVCVGLAALTRAPDALAALPLIALYARGTPMAAWRRRAALLCCGAAPLVLLLGAYNALRFGSPVESGYGPETLSAPVLIAARQAGLFSLVHLPKNLYYLLLAAPQPVGGEGAPVLSFPWVVPSPWGMGLLFVSPWLAAAVWARGRVAMVLAAGAGLLVAPALLYYSIGWVQFGYRYAIDATPFLAATAALALAQRGWARWLPPVAAACWAVNALGALWLTQTIGNP